MILQAICFASIIFVVRIATISVASIFSQGKISLPKSHELKEFVTHTSLEFIFIFFAYLVFLFLIKKLDYDDGAYQFFAFIIFISLLRSYDFVFAPLVVYFTNKKVDFQQNLNVYNVLAQNNLKSVVVHTDVINAYAMGFFNWNSIILLTQGLIDKMSDNGIRNIIYHEIGHLKEKHLLFLLTINVLATTFVFYLLMIVTPHLKNLQFEVIYVSLCSATLITVFVFLIPGLLQKYFEHRADMFAAKIVGIESYCNTLIELNHLTSNGMEKSTFNYPSLKRRLNFLRAIDGN